MNRPTLMLAILLAALAVAGIAVVFLSGGEEIARPPAPPNPPEN